jgi:hypothetical protein
MPSVPARFTTIVQTPQPFRFPFPEKFSRASWSRVQGMLTRSVNKRGKRGHRGPLERGNYCVVACTPGIRGTPTSKATRKSTLKLMEHVQAI